jgi:hypothetical protein
MSPKRVALIAGLVLILLVAGLAAYYEITLEEASSGFVTGSNLGSTNATSFYANCAISIGGFELRVLSEYTGLPVTGEKINAVDTLTITGATSSNGVGRATVTLSPTTTEAPGQTVYLDNFSAGKGGWLTPIFPPQSCPAGNLNFTVAYQDKAYNFSETIPPIGSECVTLHVPSGSVTAKTVMNGNGSYCS